jgi:1-acyl-sn-glycerol-3-phosphate acyltransferase
VNPEQELETVARHFRAHGCRWTAQREGIVRAADLALYAAKHQSMFETMALSRLLGTPAIVMKQELRWSYCHIYTRLSSPING